MTIFYDLALLGGLCGLVFAGPRIVIFALLRRHENIRMWMDATASYHSVLYGAFVFFIAGSAFLTVEIASGNIMGAITVNRLFSFALPLTFVAGIASEIAYAWFVKSKK